jgi:hypothetical protein
MVPSIADAAMHVPSGVNLQLKTSDLCSQKFAVTTALLISHSFTLRSSEQDNISLSSKDI